MAEGLLSVYEALGSIPSATEYSGSKRHKILAGHLQTEIMG